MNLRKTINPRGKGITFNKTFFCFWSSKLELWKVILSIAGQTPLFSYFFCAVKLMFVFKLEEMSTTRVLDGSRFETTALTLTVNQPFSLIISKSELPCLDNFFIEDYIQNCFG